MAAIVTSCVSVVAMGEERQAMAVAGHAVFAAGCFWCIEADLEKLEGVTEVTSGYTGGHVAEPTYEQVSQGRTGHYEAVRVAYDPQRVTYQQLLIAFWGNIDPHDAGGQFCDQGTQYRAAIFYRDPEQRAAAEASKNALETSGALKHTIVTPILPATNFWPAEERHQDYYKKNPIRYTYYRTLCGRDRRLSEIWSTVDRGSILTDPDKQAHKVDNPVAKR